MTKARVTDLRKRHRDLAPDKDYPPLRLKTLKGLAGKWSRVIKTANIVVN